VFKHACKMGLEGMSRSGWDRVIGRALAGLAQVQEPECAPAVKRKAEEDWGYLRGLWSMKSGASLGRCATLECVEGRRCCSHAAANSGDCLGQWARSTGSSSFYLR
jgi:hypothetical protein